MITRRLALTPGSRLGVYQIAAPLGEGGMGQVWRATDTTLGRQVAIKILPDAFAADPKRLARFEREAKTLASFNHPHIAAIYGVREILGDTRAGDGTRRGRGPVAAHRPRRESAG
jgi:serine/threonine protein kinase